MLNTHVVGATKFVSIESVNVAPSPAWLDGVKVYVVITVDVVGELDSVPEEESSSPLGSAGEVVYDVAADPVHVGEIDVMVVPTT